MADRPATAHVTTSFWAVRKARPAHFVSRNAGLLLVICSQFVFASMNLAVKLLETTNPPTPTIEVITLRMAVTVCCCVIYMVANRIPDPLLGPKDVRGLLVIRAIAGFSGIFGMYYALNYLSLADATVITYLGPFAIALAGHLLLGETYTKKEALAGVCSLLGIVLIARPSFLFGNTVGGDGNADTTSFQRLRAVGSALLGVGGNTGTFIIMRVIGERAHPMHIMTFFSIFCVVVGSIATAMIRESAVFPMAWRWIALLLTVGLLSVVGQLMLTMALRYETATRSSLGLYCQLFFTAVLELVVFGTVPSPLSAAGAAVIITAQAFTIISRQNPVDKPLLTANPYSDDVEERLFESDNVVTSQNTVLPP